jgi:hypothetical protein
MIFLDMHELFLFPQVDDLPSASCLQLDGVPPRYRDLVRVALGEKFPNKWMYTLPPQKPGFNCFLFFPLGYIKNIVYAKKIRDLQHRKDRICAAIERVRPDMLSCVWNEAEYRLDICRATDGAHIESY